MLRLVPGQTWSALCCGEGLDVRGRFSVTIAAVGLLALALIAAPAAQAATISPDTFTDDTDPNGNCTLREAFLSANGDSPVDGCQGGSDPDTVMLAAGTYDLTVSGDGEGGANLGDLDASEDLTIQGAGAGSTTIRWLPGDLDPDRVLEATNTGTDFTVSDLTIKGGNAGDGNGGGIATTQSSMTLNRVAVLGNRTPVASQREGGGIAIAGAGTLTVTDSLIAGNTAGGGGGGIYASGTGTLLLTNVTLSGNNALGAGVDTPGGGGAFFQGPDPTFNNATITGNDAGDGNGGGLLHADPTNITLANTILAGNTDDTPPDPHPECGIYPPSGNAFNSLGYNLLGSTAASCGFIATDMLTADPGTGPLADNGGPTPTHALLAGSPAIDAANPALPGSGGAACAAADQRGEPRPGDGNGDGVSRCDIGAFEIPSPAGPAPGEPQDPGSGPPGPGAKNVSLAAKPKKVERGKKTKLTAVVSPCAGREGNPVQFLRKQKLIAEQATDASCSAEVRVKVKRTSTYSAVAPQQGADDTTATSTPVKVKAKKQD